MRATPRLFVTFAAMLAAVSSLEAAQILYVSDTTSDSVFAFAPDGTRTTFASGLSDPTGLAFGPSGNLFVADSGSGNIFQYTPAGMRTTFASGLGSLTGLAFDSAGNLFASAQGSGEILKFAPDGTKSVFASAPLVTGGIGTPMPTGLAFDANGNLFAGVFVQTIRFPAGFILEFTPAGMKTIFAQPPGVPLVIPIGLAFDANGDLFVADSSPLCCGGILELAPNGSSTIFKIGLNPSGLAFDENGILFAGDFGNGKILKFASDGSSTDFGVTPGPGFLAFGPLTVAPGIPEPSTALLLLSGVACLVIRARNR